MVTLQSISTNNCSLLQIVQSIYEDAFPANEKVDFSSLLPNKLTANCMFKLYGIFHDNEPCGMLSIVEFNSFLFIYYLAITPTKQGLGIGNKVLELIKKESTKPLILEVEHATQDISKRRIEFYVRNGFHVNQYPYFQPALHQHTDVVPMHIMSYPHALSEEDFLTVKTALYEHVYCV